jgi:hypothetical protein
MTWERTEMEGRVKPLSVFFQLLLPFFHLKFKDFLFLDDPAVPIQL